MIIKKSEIEKVAVEPSGYPKTRYPEVAFAGRSNVGKSSLINAMLNRKSLARISGTPGKTRTINFYNVNDNLYFVDLPGYGYARVSFDEKKKWSYMIEEYLEERETLKCVVLIVDIRHEPTSDDELMAEWIRSRGCSLIIAATKADKLTKNNINKSLTVISKKLKLRNQDILISFSSETKKGRDELWHIIENICFPSNK